jgi:glycosyltransferase involved in cell wall biosynthesis
VAVSGKFRLILQASALPPNADRDIPVSLGSATANLRLSAQSQKHVLEFDLAEPANQILFHGVKKVRPEGADKRYLGIGLSSLTVSDPQWAEEVDADVSEPIEEQVTLLPPGHSQLNLTGIIYTSVFNPADGRKNWVDLVTAFCYAHRVHEDACLVLKMVTNDPESYMASLPQLLTQLAPFKCRVVAIRGFLPQDQFENLVAATTYYVNASHGEGLCLPLMEFLSAGVPAVAPDHTAMADYINDDLAFRVTSSVEQNVWPDDPRDMFRTLRYRINWESLYKAYSESYRVAREDPARYRSMSHKACEQLKEFASVEAVAGRIANFLGI